MIHDVLWFWFEHKDKLINHSWKLMLMFFIQGWPRKPRKLPGGVGYRRGYPAEQKTNDKRHKNWGFYLASQERRIRFYSLCRIRRLVSVLLFPRFVLCLFVVHEYRIGNAAIMLYIPQLTEGRPRTTNFVEPCSHQIKKKFKQRHWYSNAWSSLFCCVCVFRVSDQHLSSHPSWPYRLPPPEIRVSLRVSRHCHKAIFHPCFFWRGRGHPWYLQPTCKVMQIVLLLLLQQGQSSCGSWWASTDSLVDCYWIRGVYFF